MGVVRFCLVIVLCFVAHRTVVSQIHLNRDSSEIDLVDFRAVALLPFFTQLVVDSGIPQPRKEMRMREIAVDHINGMKWASERLKNQGYHIELSFFDEVADSSGMQLWQTEDVLGKDVIFGPLQQHELSRGLRFIERTGADHVLLTKVNEDFLLGSDAIRSIIPSESFAIDMMIDDLVVKYSEDNIIFVMTGGVNSKLESYFLSTLNNKLDLENTNISHTNFKTEPLRFDTVHGTRNSVGSLAEKIDFYKRNIVVSVAGRSARSMLSNLQVEVQMNDSTQIYVYANSEIKNLGFIDVKFLRRTRLTVPVSGSIDWSDSTTIDAVKQFRLMFKTDPSMYILRAHDAFLDAFKRKLERELGERDYSTLPQPIETDCDWKQVKQFSGYVNKNWDLETFYAGHWCKTDTLESLNEFVLPEIDQDGFFIDPLRPFVKYNPRNPHAKD
jgi:hypothetical protein